ncbi:uncharacterized protein G2W53_043094 [Senna tora]|uniref:Uncharacterized protein n=1 Tax=Senna tora TaxID=362788 RepID=A0A834SK84_9FABA|nr:uncharacterized protein G2W53_043094 [Senna tora]
METLNWRERKIPGGVKNRSRGCEKWRERYRRLW